MEPPYDGGGDADGGEIIFDVSVEARGDPAVVFDSLDNVALAIDRFVVVVLDRSVLSRRDDRLAAAFDQPFAQLGIAEGRPI